MAKRGFPKEESFKEGNFKEDQALDFSQLDPGLEPGGQIRSGMSIFISRVLAVLKFILGLCLLVFVYSSTLAFLREIKALDYDLRDAFWAGIGTFLVVYLFVLELSKVYMKGQKLLALLFKFVAPLVRVAPYVLPIYTLIIFALYPLFALFIKSKAVLNYFIFLGSFSMSLHLVYSAKSLRTRQGDFLKANYIFGFSLIFILNVLLMAGCLSMIVEKFSFVNFFDAASQSTQKIIQAVFKQIFVPA
jgi:hypothetical protein